MLSLTSNSSYTHLGWNDTINVEIWLPLDDWNGYTTALALFEMPSFMLTSNVVDSRVLEEEAIKQAMARLRSY